MKYIKEPIKIFFTCLLVLIVIAVFFLGNGLLSYYTTLVITNNENWAVSVTMVWEFIIMISLSMAFLRLRDKLERLR